MGEEIFYILPNILEKLMRKSGNPVIVLRHSEVNWYIKEIGQLRRYLEKLPCISRPILILCCGCLNACVLEGGGGVSLCLQM